MFKSCKCKKCCCINKCNDFNNDVFENLCNDVSNTLEYSDACDCGFDEEDNVFPTNPMFAQSYVPWQTMDKTFRPCVGLKMGTIFPELVSPYEANQSVEEIAYIEATNKMGEGCNKC